VLTEIPLKLTASSLTFILAGMFLGNMILIFLGLLPILSVLLGLLIRQPVEIEVENLGENFSVWVNDVIEISRRVKISNGIGLVTFGEQIPPSFELVSGSNFKVVWKGFRDLEDVLTYKIKCTMRGVYYLDVLNWEERHPLNLTPTQIGVFEINQMLTVRPRPFHIKRIRQQKAFSRMPMPTEAKIKTGIPTTDFREIREYTFGDPYKHINWKATSRISSQRKPPQVNEFEREGRKIVWIFLNSAKRMALGTTLHNSFEYAVQAVLGLSQFYLSKGCKVGLSIYNDDKSEIYTDERFRSLYHWKELKLIMPDIASTQNLERHERRKELIEEMPIVHSTEEFILPDLGRRQQYKITKKMLNTDISEGNYNLRQAIKKCRRYILGSSPLFIIVTMIDEKKVGPLVDGLRELQKYVRKTRIERPSILLLHVSGYNIVTRTESKEITSELLELEEISILRTLRGFGVRVVHWNPKKQSFNKVLLSQVIRS